MSNKIELLNGNSEHILWVKFEINQRCIILIGVVYIPPSNSNYSSNDMFDDIEQDIMSFKNMFTQRMPLPTSG